MNELRHPIRAATAPEDLRPGPTVNRQQEAAALLHAVRPLGGPADAYAAAAGGNAGLMTTPLPGSMDWVPVACAACGAASGAASNLDSSSSTVAWSAPLLPICSTASSNGYAQSWSAATHAQHPPSQQLLSFSSEGALAPGRGFSSVGGPAQPQAAGAHAAGELLVLDARIQRAASLRADAAASGSGNQAAVALAASEWGHQLPGRPCTTATNDGGGWVAGGLGDGGGTGGVLLSATMNAMALEQQYQQQHQQQQHEQNQQHQATMHQQAVNNMALNQRQMAGQNMLVLGHGGGGTLAYSPDALAVLNATWQSATAAFLHSQLPGGDGFGATPASSNTTATVRLPLDMGLAYCWRPASNGQ